MLGFMVVWPAALDVVQKSCLELGGGDVELQSCIVVALLEGVYTVDGALCENGHPSYVEQQK